MSLQVKPPPQYGSPGWDQWWADFNRGWDDEDLYCDEHLSASEEEEEHLDPGEGNSQDSRFSSTPPKRRKPNPAPNDFPACLAEYLSNATLGNKCYNCFLCYSTYEKWTSLYDKLLGSFNALFCGAYECNDKTGAIIYCITPKRHRVSAVFNACSKLCTVSFLLIKAVLRNSECYMALQGEDFTVIQESKDGGLHSYDFHENSSKKEECDWNVVASFATDTDQADPLVIMGYYMEFANDPAFCEKCKKGLKVHAYHEAHWSNAKLFKAAKNQKTIAQQACDRVLAVRRLLMLESSREDLVLLAFKKQFKYLAENYGGGVEITQLLGAVAWLDCLMLNFTTKIREMIHILTANIPKKRNLLFKGPINSGKTTVAAAILDLLGGVSLNVNCTPDKLNFELGCAIDKFICVIEDVKGTPMPNTNLTQGCGMTNLDNLRDHLDGCVAVNMERKHVNKVSQLFPPSIITCNEYYIPVTVKARIARGYYFLHKPCLQKCLKDSILMSKRMLQRGSTLLAALIWWEPVSDFMEDIQEDVVNWKQTFEKWVSFGMYQTMKENILAGNDPFTGVLVDESFVQPQENDETSDSTQESGLGSMHSM